MNPRFWNPSHSLPEPGGLQCLCDPPHLAACPLDALQPLRTLLAMRISRARNLRPWLACGRAFFARRGRSRSSRSVSIFRPALNRRTLECECRFFPACERPIDVCGLSSGVFQRTFSSSSSFSYHSMFNRMLSRSDASARSGPVREEPARTGAELQLGPVCGRG
jgi:hypothetical protein